LTNGFDNPKPVSLIRYLITLYSENPIILDFFAGSGTTGQAVLELNASDNGSRQFILCTNNEITDTTPNGVVVDVTSKRLKRVMTGKCYDGTANFEWTKKNKPLGGHLEVYDIATVFNREAIEGKTPFDVIDETLYGQEKFSTVKEKTEWVCDNFEHTQKGKESDEEWIERQETK
jgi:adenine-specific DNA-methyltransferase